MPDTPKIAKCLSSIYVSSQLNYCHKCSLTTTNIVNNNLKKTGKRVGKRLTKPEKNKRTFDISENVL